MQRLLFAGCALALIACPLGLIGLMLFTQEGVPYYRRWGDDMNRQANAVRADQLFIGHLSLSAVVSPIVLWRARGTGKRIVLGALILGLTGATAILYFLACIHTTGINF